MVAMQDLTAIHVGYPVARRVVRLGDERHEDRVFPLRALVRNETSTVCLSSRQLTHFNSHYPVLLKDQGKENCRHYAHH